jgi:hypothetical protein
MTRLALFCILTQADTLDLTLVCLVTIKSNNQNSYEMYECSSAPKFQFYYRLLLFGALVRKSGFTAMIASFLNKMKATD